MNNQVKPIKNKCKALNIENMKKRGISMLNITKINETKKHFSYEFILNALLDHFESVPIEYGTVNVFGIAAAHDPFWKGNLEEIERIFNRIGLRVNTFFNGATHENLASAELNLVLSPWLGINAVKRLKQKLKTPYIINPLPIGIKETSAMIKKVGDALRFDVNEVVEDEEDKVYESLKNRATLVRDSELPLSFATITDSNYAIAFNRFLTDEFGWKPTTAVIVEQVPQTYQRSIHNYLRLNRGVSPKIVHETDPGKIWKLIEQDRPNIILGRSIDRYIANKIGSANLSVSHPLKDRIVLNRGYTGYNGTVNLIEDLLNQIITPN